MDVRLKWMHEWMSIECVRRIFDICLYYIWARHFDRYSCHTHNVHVCMCVYVFACFVFLRCFLFDISDIDDTNKVNTNHNMNRITVVVLPALNRRNNNNDRKAIIRF